MAPDGPQAADPAAGASAGQPYLTAIATPFLIALKIPFCIATAGIAAPVAAASAMAVDETGPDLRHALADGLVANCGPPYVLPP